MGDKIMRKKKSVEEKVEEIKVEEIKVETKKKEVVRNLTKAHHKVYGVFVAPGAIYEVNEADKKDKLGTLRLENAIKQGKLDWL